MPHFPEIRSMADVPRYHAAERPDATAMIFGEWRTSYRDWNAGTSRVANGLIAQGVKPQGRVAWLDKNSDFYFEVLFGAAKANAVTVPVNWRLAAPEVAFIINDAKAEVLFVGPAFYALAKSIAPELKTVRKIVAMEKGHETWEWYEDWRARHGDTDPMLPSAGQDVVIQLYTSGTTGNPKGAMLTNANFLDGRAQQSASPETDFIRVEAGEHSLVAMPVGHIGGTGWGFSGLYNGATNVILAEFTPRGVLEAIRDYKIARAFIVPAAMKFVIEDPLAASTDFSPLKYILYGASPIPLDLLRRAMDVFQCGFVQVYGMTETTGSVTYLPPEDHDPNGNARMRSAGKAFPGVEIRIAGADGHELPRGEVGEIWIRTIQNMAGYWNLPEASAKTMGPDGWLRSGDAGYMDADGYVFVHDRVKDMIVSGAENVYPAEVESAIFGHPAVADVAVIGVPDDKWGEAVKAIVVLKPGMSAAPEEIIGFARARIAGFKCPKTVDFIDALPRNASGKILKKDLRAPFWAGRERQVN
jgi:acyl-CoA synthetase (AMP-forming)/AMP-acid ligase II